MQTSCPNCQAQFIVTPESLEIADGMVRCGQCNQVFDAEENLIASSEAPSIDDSLQADGSTHVDDSLQADDEDLELVAIEHEDLDEASGLIDDDLTAHQPDPFDEDIYSGLIDNELEQSSSIDSEQDFSLDDKLLGSDFNDDLDTSLENSDFSLDDQLADLTEETLPSQTNEITEEADNINYSLDESAAENNADFDDLDSGDDLLAQLDQLDADYDSSNLDDELQAEESLLADEFSSTDGSIEDNNSDTENTLDGATSSAHKFPSIKEYEGEDIVMRDTSLPERKMPINSADEPSFFKQSRFIKQSAAALFSWLIASVLLILLLGAQYLHFNSNSLTQNNSYRPLLEVICPISQCELGLLKSTRQIVTIDHDVYSHNKYENALEVQLTFKNKAAENQAYPIVEIIFSNPLGAVIAQRRFLPAEYINNKNQISQGMKANQSQKIKLDIIDPDPSTLLSFEFNYL